MLSEISCERIDHAREFAAYIWFNQAKLCFFFQRQYHSANKCYPLEIFHINNWLFVQPNMSAKASSTTNGGAKTRDSKNQAQCK
mmetsp:Transcript_12639/g.17064  ORF Transcript_12639/g.17064 Transcript_12639/m.17064 type:complete len:84 (+) Transcript_12639:367-618(+)